MTPHGFEPVDYDPVLPADDGVAWIILARPAGLPGWVTFHVGPFADIEAVVRWVDAHPDVEYSVVGLIHPDDFLAHPDAPDAPGDAP